MVSERDWLTPFACRIVIGPPRQILALGGCTRPHSNGFLNSFQKLLDFLGRLEKAKIHYSLAHFRTETIAVEIVMPGERWEVEFFADGCVEIEVFSSVGTHGIELEGEAALERLLTTHRS